MNDQTIDSDEVLNARSRRIDLAHHSDFDLGPVKVRPSLRKIVGPLGEATLEPKVMQVLTALSDPIGNIMSRDDLIDRCWDGRIVGDTSINRVISLLRSGLKEVADDLVVVENIPKVGYRLLLVGQPDEPQTEPAPEVSIDGGDLKSGRSYPMYLTAVGAAILLLLGAIWWMRPASEPSIEDIRLVMLPLEIGEGVDPIYSSGLESELRSAFAKVGAMEVTASESAQILLDHNISPVQVGEKLKADYVWIGRFETEAERSSLDVQIINVATGAEFFARNFQSAPDEAEHLPFRTARAISTALSRPIRSGQAQDEVSAGDYRLYLVALGLLKTRGSDENKAALEILQQVTARNPRFADGWGALSKAKFLIPAARPSEREKNSATARDIAKRALELDPDTVEAIKVIGISSENVEEALGQLGRAVQLDPGDSEAWFWLATTQRKFILEGAHPLASAQKMLEIDPLWPPTWLGSDMAAHSGRLDIARKMESDVMAAAVSPSERLFSEARIARLEGDLSGYVRLMQNALRSATESERLWGSGFQDRSIRILLGMPQVEGVLIPRQKAPAAVMDEIDLARLPSRETLRAFDLTGVGAWDDMNFVKGALPLYLQYDRHAELLSDFDARFPDHAAYIEFAKATGQPERVIPEISVYLVLALRREGREEDAAKHLDTLEKVMVRWSLADLNWLDQKIIQLEYAALIGDEAKAVEIVQSLPDFAWPYSVATIDPTNFNLLKDDPLFDSIRNLPKVRAVIDPIRQRMKTERAEIEALGL